MYLTSLVCIHHQLLFLARPLGYSMTSQLCFFLPGPACQCLSAFSKSSDCRTDVCARIHPPAHPSPCTFAPEKSSTATSYGQSTCSNYCTLINALECVLLFTPPPFFSFLLHPFFISDGPPCLSRSHTDRFSLVLIMVNLVRPHVDRISFYVST